MRSLFLLVPAAFACETNYFKDAACGEVTNTWKMDMGSIKGELTVEGTTAWIPGVCLTFGTPVKNTFKPETGEEMVFETGSTYGLSGTGYGGYSYLNYGKDIKECEYDYKKHSDGADHKAKDPIKRESTLDGKVNICESTSQWSGLSTKKQENSVYAYTACGPVPGAVWGIILSSLGLVFSFAGLGLAAVAGK